MIAPAKVNLALHVTGRRADGYHLLETLVAFAGDGDLVQVEAARRDEIVVSGRYAAHVPTGGDNLIARARDLLRRTFGGATRAPVRLHLDKALPVASGIGGGSSDAAAALHLLCAHWGLVVGSERLCALGLRLGADLPMCLAGRPLMARGIGDALEAVDRFPALPLVLVSPNVPLATAQVFATLEQRRNAPLPALPPVGDVQGAARWLAAARNDLEVPARRLVPQIGEVLTELEAAGALASRMSGSGAACFGVFASPLAAARAGRDLAGRRPDWFVLTTQTGAAEKCHGR